MDNINSELVYVREKSEQYAKPNIYENLKDFVDVFGADRCEGTPFAVDEIKYFEGKNSYNAGKKHREPVGSMVPRADHRSGLRLKKYGIRVLASLPYWYDIPEPQYSSSSRLGVGIWHLPQCCSWYHGDGTVLDIAGLESVLASEEFEKDVLEYYRLCRERK